MSKELLQAVESGNLEMSLQLLQNSESSPIETHEDKMIFHKAFHANNKKMIELLLNYELVKDCLNEPDIVGLTPLMLAVEKAYPDIVKNMLAKGANPHLREKGSQTALTKAIKGGDVLVTKTLLEEDTIKNSPWILNNALKVAIRENQATIVDVLLENFEIPNYADEEGLTALILAKKIKNPYIIKKLKGYFGSEDEQYKANPELERYIKTCKIIKEYGEAFNLHDSIKVRLPESKHVISVSTKPSNFFQIDKQPLTSQQQNYKLKKLIKSYQSESNGELKKVIRDLLGCLVYHYQTDVNVDRVDMTEEQKLNKCKIILSILTAFDRYEVIESLANDFDVSIDLSNI